MKSRAIVFPRANEVELRDFDVPPPGQGQIRTRTIVTGISTGTETRVLRGGEDPNAFPCIPGYENVGEVLDVGDGVTGFAPGDIVFHLGSTFTGEFTRMWGGQCGVALIPEAEAFAVPAGLDPEAAVHGVVGAIALHGVRRGRVAPGDTVAVVGLGLIGHLAAQCARALGARVIGIDRDESRLEAVRNAGVEETIDASTSDLHDRVREMTAGGVDVAIDATGLASVVDSTARLVRQRPWGDTRAPNARVVLLGSCEQPISFDYHPTLFDNEPDILPSRHCAPEEIREVLEMCGRSEIRPECLNPETLPASEAPAAYERLLSRQASRILLDWNSTENG